MNLTHLTEAKRAVVAALAWLAVVLGLAGGAAQAAPGYSVTDLGTLGGTYSQANGINASGQVVGWSYTAGNTGGHAFLYSGGVMSDLGTLGGDGGSVAAGINSSGQVVGYAYTAGNAAQHAFVYNGGVMSDLGTLGGAQSFATGINDSGQVVGWSGVPAPSDLPSFYSHHHAFLYSGGVMREIDSLGGETSSSFGFGINASGQVVGQTTSAGDNAQHAFVYSGGVMSDLGTLDGTSIAANINSVANGINASGQVVGAASSAGNPSQHAFVYSGGVMSDLGTLGGSWSVANGINASGQVVGHFVFTADNSLHAFLYSGGGMKDLNDLIDPTAGWVLQVATAINDAGQIAGYGSHNGLTRAFLLTPARKPVLIIPGVGATYPADVGDIGPWMFTRGIHPDGLQIDPLGHAYDDLIKTLENVGYVQGKNLFVVKYDWRLPPGPSDGVFDGVVGGLSAASISDQSFDYAVDYMGYYLKKAQEAWQADHPNDPPLDKVNVIAHSTGGLVGRTYIQSAAYGGTFDGTQTLPKVDQFIMIGVPNRGASKAWNPLHDNWGVDITFQLVLSKILNMGYQKVLGGAIITGPDIDISLNTLLAPTCQDVPEICFIQQFNPTTRALLATYDFIDFKDGNGFTNVNSDPFLRNDLVLDLNAGLDFVLNGDPNAFADQATVTAIYATNVATPTAAVKNVGPGAGGNGIVPFSDFTARDAQPGEVWYDDIVAPLSGDGTVPLDSSAGQFIGDPRVSLKPFAQGDNTSQDVSHLGLMYNADVQKEVLGILGASFNEDNISTTLHSAIASVMSTAANVAPNIILGSILGAIFDPVEGFIVDGQGRRLGYSALTGPITEIPGSVWFGNADGLAWVFEPLVAPLKFELSGLGGSYYVQASVLSADGSSGITDQGTLALGASRVVAIPTSPTVSSPPTAHSNKSSSAFSEAGYKAYATFNVQHDPAAAAPSGRLSFTSSKTRRKLVSTGIDSLAVSGATAVIAGSCTLNGVGGYSFTATVGDQATPGAGADTFAITVTGPNGFSYTASGTISSGDYTVSGQ